MQWIKCPEGMHNGRSCLPLNRQFLALWRGAIGLCQYDENDDAFYLSIYPACYGVQRIDREREGKITHWCELEIPSDYP